MPRTTVVAYAYFHNKSITKSAPTFAIGLKYCLNYNMVWKGGGTGKYPM